MQNTTFTNRVQLDFSSLFSEHRQDISAVLLTPENHLWLGSDETSTIERLDWMGEKIFANHQQFHVSNYIELPAPESEEIDIEGLAYTDEYLWFVGSHSYKRKKPKPDKSGLKNFERLATIATEANRYILGRIPLVNGNLHKFHPHPHHPDMQLNAAKLQVTPQGNTLIDALQTDPHLGAFIQAKIPGKDNGFDIEGIAVEQNRIFLGLRGPVLRGWAIILEVEVTSNNPGILELCPIGIEGRPYKKHFFNLQGLGIRDLLRDGDDFLILAGPTMDLDGPVTVYRQQDGIHLQEGTFNHPVAILAVPFGDGDDHAEGITLFSSINGSSSLLVVYDSPASDRLLGETGILADIFELP